MSQKSLERQPLMDVGNLSQPNDVGAEKKAPFLVPAASAASQVIDLCAEVDMTFAFNQSVLPTVASKAKTKAAAKPKVSAPKAAATAPKKDPAPKKAKKSKIDVEFDKLTPLEQLDFLKGKAQLLLQLEQDPSVQVAAIMEEATTESAITTSAHAISSDDMQMCTLRLELGAVLSSEAEMRAKERKIRLQIKRLQRKMTMALPPIVVTHKETVPQYSISDALFVVPSLEDSSVLLTCTLNKAESTKNMTTSATVSTNENDVTPESFQSTYKPLWRLAQQDAHFEFAVAPRLLSVDRDAVLLPEIPQSLAPSSPAAAQSAHTAETPHSPEHDRDASEHVSPVSSPCMVQTDIVNDVRSMDVCVTGETTMYAEDHNITTVMDTISDTFDIYEVTSSNESNAGDVGNEGGNDADCYEPTTLYANTSTHNANCTVHETSLVANLYHQKDMHCEAEESHHKRQKLHNEQLNNNVLSTVRAGLFTHNTLPVEAGLEPSQSVLTQPPCKVAECVIDLCSPELLPPIKSTNILSKAIPLSTHTMPTTVSLTRINSNTSGGADYHGVQSIAHSDSTPDCNNCIIHYVPSDYIESSSEEQYPSSSQPVGALRSCISKRLHYSQQSEVNTCSQYVPQSQSQASQAAMTTTVASESSTANLSTNTTTSTSISTTANTTTNNSLNILTSSTLPDFTTLSLPQIREIVQYYGLKEDSRYKMISLLRAMWCRVHGKKAISGTVTATTNVNSTNNGCVASASAAKVTAVKAVETPQQSVQVVLNTQSIPPSLPPPQLLPHLLTQSTSHHQMLVSSFLTQSVTSTSSSSSNQSAFNASKATTCSDIANSTSITTTSTNTAKPTTATRFELTLSDLKQYIRNHDTLYQQVLQYKPIELDTLQASIVSTGVYKVSRAKLLEMLDSLAIFVSNTSNRNSNSNKGKAGGNKGKKRKQLSQCSV